MAVGKNNSFSKTSTHKVPLKYKSHPNTARPLGRNITEEHKREIYLVFEWEESIS